MAFPSIEETNSAQNKASQPDYRIEEWKRLNDEIKTNTTRMHAALVLALGGTTAIFGIANDVAWPGNAFFCLLPLMILLPAALFIYSQMASTERIASYCRTYFEKEHLGLNWETRLYQIENNSVGPSIGSSFSFSISGILNSVALISFFVGLFFLFPSSHMEACKEGCNAGPFDDFPNWAFPIIYLILFTLGYRYLLRRTRMLKQAKKDLMNLYDERWKSLKFNSSYKKKSLWIPGSDGLDGHPYP